MKPLRLAPLVLFLTLPAWADLPSGPVVVSGGAAIIQVDTGLHIANTPGTIIQWDRFNIGAGERVHFEQWAPASAVLNRVTGMWGESRIDGMLSSNGRVFLINRNGILFGPGSRVDVAGLVASTLNISNEDFLAGRYRFRCENDAYCGTGGPDRINLAAGAQITTRNTGDGGQVWLIASNKISSEAGSKIEAPGGQAMLALGSTVSITSPALGLITFSIDTTQGSQIDLAGDIDVPRGAAGFFADSIRFAGKVSARSASTGAGQIVAAATDQITLEQDAKLDVSAEPDANAGAVRLEARRTISIAPSAEIAADASGQGRGGEISLRAYVLDMPPLWGFIFDPVHAWGDPIDGSLDGAISVDETGTFDLSWSGGFPSFSGSFIDIYTDIADPSRVTNHSATSDLFQISSGGYPTAGDGSTLITISRDNGGFAENGSFMHKLQVSSYRIITSTGSVFDISLTTPLDSSYGVGIVFGLTKGGWAITFRNTALPSLVYIIKPDGQIARILSFSTPNTFVYAVPLLSGDILVREQSSYNSPVLYGSVFRSSGEEISGTEREQLLQNVRNATFINKRTGIPVWPGFSQAYSDLVDLPDETSEWGAYEEGDSTIGSHGQSTTTRNLQHRWITWKNSQLAIPDTSETRINATNQLAGGYNVLGRIPEGDNLYRVPWRKELSTDSSTRTETTEGTGLYSLSGGLSVLVATQSYWRNDIWQRTTSETNVSPLLNEENANSYSAHVASLNIASSDGHWYPSRDYVPGISGGYFSEEAKTSMTVKVDINQLTRTPRNLPDRARQASGTLVAFPTLYTLPGTANGAWAPPAGGGDNGGTGGSVSGGGSGANGGVTVPIRPSDTAGGGIFSGGGPRTLTGPSAPTAQGGTGTTLDDLPPTGAGGGGGGSSGGSGGSGGAGPGGGDSGDDDGDRDWLDEVRHAREEIERRQGDLNALVAANEAEIDRTLTDMIGAALGPRWAEDYRNGTPAVKRRILEELTFNQQVGPGLGDVLKGRSDEMKTTTVTALADFQMVGLPDEDNEGLRKVIEQPGTRQEQLLRERNELLARIESGTLNQSQVEAAQLRLSEVADEFAAAQQEARANGGREPSAMNSIIRALERRLNMAGDDPAKQEAARNAFHYDMLAAARRAQGQEVGDSITVEMPGGGSFTYYAERPE